jgi:hypothetical protein
LVFCSGDCLGVPVGGKGRIFWSSRSYDAKFQKTASAEIAATPGFPATLESAFDGSGGCRSFVLTTPLKEVVNEGKIVQQGAFPLPIFFEPRNHIYCITAYIQTSMLSYFCAICLE